MIKVDSEIWKMFMALSVMRGIGRGELLEESIKETIKETMAYYDTHREEIEEFEGEIKKPL